MNRLPLGCHRYRVSVIEPFVRERMLAEDRTVSWCVVAGSLPSAWRKFCRQRFGALLPDPSHYDIRLEQ